MCIYVFLEQGKAAISAYGIIHGVIYVTFLPMSRNLALKYYYDYLNVKAC